MQRPRPARRRGFSLIELMAATSILTLLALMAVPYAQTAKDREQEVQLIDSLTRLREAIALYAYNEPNGDEDGDGIEDEDPAGDADGDGVFDDDKDGRIDEDGFPNYPPTLQDLVTTGYLSAIPPDPFRRPSQVTNWTVSYIQRRADWHEDGVDEVRRMTPGIYDVRSGSAATGLNGSRYSTW